MAGRSMPGRVFNTNLAVAISAPAALAQAKKAECPFTSKDIDGWYKDIGFDTGADDAGRAGLVSCTGENLNFATLDESEYRMGPKTVDGETVTASPLVMAPGRTTAAYHRLLPGLMAWSTSEI